MHTDCLTSTVPFTSSQVDWMEPLYVLLVNCRSGGKFKGTRLLVRKYLITKMPHQIQRDPSSLPGILCIRLASLEGERILFIKFFNFLFFNYFQFRCQVTFFCYTIFLKTIILKSTTVRMCGRR